MAGLLGGFDPTMASLGLLSLGNLFQPPKYSTNIADVTGPDNTGFNNAMQMGLLARQMKRDKLLESQALRQQQLADLQLSKARREQQAEEELGAAASGYLARNPQQTTMQNAQGLPTLPDAPGAMKVGIPGTGGAANPAGLMQDPNYLAVLARRYPTQFATMAGKKPKMTTVSPGGALVNEDTGEVVFSSPKEAAPTNLAKLQSELDAMPPGDPRRSVWQSMIQKESQRDPYIISTVPTPQGPMPVAVPRPGTAGAAGAPVPPLGAQLPPGAYPLGIPQKEPPRLDNAGRTTLGEVGGVASRFDTLNSTFKDNFAGYKSDAIGDFALKAGRNMPFLPGAATTAAADWWQGYQEHKNIVRNKLFGSALTDTERVEFDKAQITPGMDPALVKKNLARQNAAAKKAAAKLAKSYLADGYKPEAIEAALGFKLSDLDGVPQNNEVDPLNIRGR